MGQKEYQVESNALDIVRLYAALCVMLLHFTGYYQMLAGKSNHFLHAVREVTLCFPGVVILFAISGFLIAHSYERSSDPIRFFQKRVLRLYPELWGATIVNLVVLIVLVRDKLDRGIFLWLLTQFAGIANTPSCLKDFATGSVNGALWTVFVEIQMYVVILFFYPWLKKFTGKQWCVLLGTSMILNLACAEAEPYIGGFGQKILERTFLPYILWFLLGVCCYCQGEKIVPRLKRWSPLLLAGYVVLYKLRINEYGYYCGIVTSLFCPLITIGIGYLLPLFRVKRDLSYGCFLYHWIVLNVMVHFDLMNRLPWYLCISLFVICTGLFAWSSVTLIGNRVKNLGRVRNRQ